MDDTEQQVDRQMDEQKRLLLAASNTDPSNPEYPYLLARLKVKCVNWDTNEMDYSGAQPFLERSLKANPQYLPTRYLLAMSKPTRERRAEALQRLAAADPGNAEPYYLMALDAFRQFDKRQFAKTADDLGARDITLQEWHQISDLIEQGNMQANLEWRVPQVPSSRDIELIIHGKALPARARDSYIAINLDILGGAEDARFDPGGFLTGMRYRQLARQSVWAARLASKSGDDAKAVHYLDVMMRMGYAVARCKPERLLSYFTGHSVWLISKKEAVTTLKRAGNMPAAWELDKQRKAWRDASNKVGLLLNKVFVTDKSVKTSRTEYLQYGDREAERAAMRKILAGLRP